MGVSSFVAPAVSNRSRGGRGNHGNARKTSNSSSQHYNRKRSESTTSETSLGVDSTSSGCRIDGNPTAAELFQEGQLFLPFTLLEIARGTIYPTLPNSYGDGDAGQGQVSHASGAQRKKASAALTLKDIVPAVDAPHAAFCQTVRATTAMMRQLFVQERCALLVFRQECRPAADVVTDVVEESKAAPRQREAVEARAGAIEDAAQTPAQQRRWASLLSNQSNSAAVESPTSSVATQQQGSAAVMAHIYGDVEALPFIDQELQSINDREKAFEQQLKQSPSDESIDREQSAAPESTESDDHQNVRYAKDDCSYLYQHAAAEMLFMHPVCSKCLLDAAASTSAPNVVTNSSPPALDMNKHGVKLTAEQPASQSDITSTFAAEQQQQHHREPRTEAFTSLATSDGVEAMDSTNATQLNSAQQSNDGVSPLAVRLLPPSNLHCRIIEVETHRVTAEFRQRYPVFRHLPLHCEILLAEVDVKNLVPPHVYERFHEEIAKRAARRKSREQQKRREQKLDQDRRCVTSRCIYCMFSTSCSYV